jgi:hypothetical protein
MELIDLLLPDPVSYLNESYDSSDGIYYVVKVPTRWELITLRYRDTDDAPNHPDLWAELVAPALALSWAKKLKMDRDVLETKLKPLYLGFPRGRIEDIGGGEYVHMHGNDLAETGITFDKIEAAFGIRGVVKHEFDPHETQNKDQALAIRSVIRMI